MELRAVIEALEANTVEAITIVTDSEYVVKIFTEWLPSWKSRGMRTSAGRRVENQDLIERLESRLADRDVEFLWVKGHAGHPLNERADSLANEAARRAQAKLASLPE
jgi:ribonuclease HI